MNDLNFRSARDEFAEIEKRWMALSSREALLGKREQEVRKREAEVRRMMGTGGSRHAQRLMQTPTQTPMQTPQTPMLTPMVAPMVTPMPMPLPPPMRREPQHRQPAHKYGRTNRREREARSEDKNYSQYAVQPRKALRGESVVCANADNSAESL